MFKNCTIANFVIVNDKKKMKMMAMDITWPWQI